MLPSPALHTLCTTNIQRCRIVLSNRGPASEADTHASDIAFLWRTSRIIMPPSSRQPAEITHVRRSS